MKRMKIVLTTMVLLFFLIGTIVYAGNSSIYLMKIELKNGNYNFTDLQKVTNTKAYNSHPYFLPDGESFFYSSAIEGQTEIFRYFIKEKKRVRITNNLLSEYSPTPMPDGRHFSSVQIFIENREKWTQSLIAFPLKGGKSITLYKGDKKIDYHAWMNKRQLALYILGKPNTLQYLDLNSGKFQIIAENIGRSIRKVPGEKAVSFSHIINKNKEVVKTVDFDGKRMKSIVQLRKNGDYYSWQSKSILITVSDSKLYKYKVGIDKNWVELKSFSKSGVKGITRIALSKKGDRIAFVSSD